MSSNNNFDTDEIETYQPIKSYSSSDYLKLIDKTTWPEPAWMREISDKKYSIVTNFFGKKLKYEDYFASELRARYMELEADFRTIYSDYIVGRLEQEEKEELPYLLSISEYIVYVLGLSRKILDIEKPEKKNLLVAINLLNLAEECLVWIIPLEQVGINIPDLMSRVDAVKPDNSSIYRQKLNLLDIELNKIIQMKDDLSELKQEKDINEIKLSIKKQEIDPYLLLQEKEKNEDLNSKPDTAVEDKIKFLRENHENLCSDRDKILSEIDKKYQAIDKFKDEYRSLFDEVIWACNKKLLDNTINLGLQIERLSGFRNWGLMFFIIFVLFSPLFLNINAFYKIGYNYNNSYLAALGVAIIGGAGGFLSGLLQVRGSSTTLALYEESVILLQLRPMFGAFAALILTMLLSWGALEGILSNSMGSYILVAFLSGFSERYFLNILKIDLADTKHESRGDQSIGKQITAENKKT